MSMSNSNKNYYIFPTSLAARLQHQDEEEAHSSPSPTLSKVGGKALSLYETSSEFPVPPGFVLTVTFFGQWLDQIKSSNAWKNYAKKQSRSKPVNDDDEANNDSINVAKEDCDAIKEECKRNLSFDDDQIKLLGQAVKAAFGPDADLTNNLGIVAVRSSSPEEDLAGTSFAGGYETSLGITSRNLQDAIIDSFASLFDHRIHLYKIQHGMLLSIDEPRIAIIIQRQIASDVSGVGFSINPNNNCYDEIMISANFGLGESVVSGTVTPDTYIVDRFQPGESKILEKKVAEKTSSVWLNNNNNATTTTSSSDGGDDGNNNVNNAGGTRQEDNLEPKAQALTDEQILEVADLVARVEEKYHGLPVDTEWAFCNGKLYLLQARPVTAYVPLFQEMVTERGEERKLYLDIMIQTQGFSDPVSTLGLDLWKTILARIKPTMSTEGKDGLVWNLHGREYFHVSNLLTMTGGTAMVDKVLRTSDKSLDRAFASIDMKDYTPSKVPEGAKGILWKSLVRFGGMIPSIFRGLYRGDQAMTDYVQRSDIIIEKCYSDECSKDELFGEAWEELITMYNAILPAVGGYMAGLFSRAILHNWTFSKCEDAHDHLINMCMDLNGNPTSEMGCAMVRLASYPEIQETDSSKDFLQKVKDDGSDCSQEFMDDYNTYLKKFGCRGIREIDAATPRTYENQAGLFDTLKAIDINNNQIINVRERRDKAYQALLQMAKDNGNEKQFTHHADIIQSLMGYREHPKYMLVVMIARMRRHALNIAEEFVAQGRLEKVDQVFALTIDQVMEAQRNAGMELLPFVKANLSPVEAVAHIKNWPTLIDSRGKIIRGTRKEVDSAEEGTLLGDPISPGTIKGRAKVLMSPYEKPVKSGEILVARFTEPSWTPLFINAAGVVMEIGGPMQHGAIIAREYGIPCVSGIVSATKLIKDGDLLEVDGSSGTVRVVDDEKGNKGVSNGAKK